VIAALTMAIALLGLLVVASVQAWLEREEDARAGSLTLLRTLVLLVAAAVSLMSLTEFSPVSLVVAALLLAVWLLQQLLGRYFGGKAPAQRLAKRFDAAVSAWAGLVGGIRLTTPDPPQEFEQELYDSVEEFTETVVREVMVPRVDIEVLAADDNLESALSQFISSGHSRIPVIRKSIDDVVGMLYLKDVARVAHRDPARLATTQVIELARTPLFTPESKPVVDLLREMQQTSTQIAVVSDEYGGVAGLVTMEDLIEELIGDISDEYDHEPEEIEVLDEQSYRVSPRLAIVDLAEHCQIELDDEDVDTVGGLFTKHLGELPKGGESVQVGVIELIAERVEPKNQRIISILVRKNV
jgi:Mg2+/Co2+ transporter CorC